MTSQAFKEWLEELCYLASAEEVDLGVNEYQYHGHFMRGFLPESVIQEINGKS